MNDDVPDGSELVEFWRSIPERVKRILYILLIAFGVLELYDEYVHPLPFFTIEARPTPACTVEELVDDPCACGNIAECPGDLESSWP